MILVSSPATFVAIHSYIALSSICVSEMVIPKFPRRNLSDVGENGTKFFLHEMSGWGTPEATHCKAAVSFSITIILSFGSPAIEGATEK